jgi:hypothetical protein
VAAVATLLGLLLVVTFIANFLTTIVPNQMEINDLNHVIAVEDQMGRLAALLASGGALGSVGMQFVQPITLGSDGVAPWAHPDGSSLGGGRIGASVDLSYGLLGQFVYSPPLGSPQGGPALPASCTFTSITHVGITCTAVVAKLAYNFSGNSKAFSVTSSASAGLYALNFSTNQSTVLVSAVGGANVDLGIYGSNVSVTLSVNGGARVNVTLVGNNDYLNLGPTGPASVVVRTYGKSNSLYEASSGVGKMLVISYGNADSITANASGAATYVAYVTGFNATNPISSLCPYDNVSRTETLHGTGASASYKAYFNNTVFNGALTAAPWTVTDQVVAPTTCPFFARQPVSIASPSATGAGLVLRLSNTYSPSGEVAYDEGAVVYAQYGGYPVMIDAPSIALTVVGGQVTAASLWIPYFTGPTSVTSGIGTETVTLRLVHSQSLTTSAGAPNLAINPNVPISLTILTPYAEAWVQYLGGHPAYSGLWTCAPAAVCTGAYGPASPLGTVTITIPTSSLSQLTIGTTTFAAALS